MIDRPVGQGGAESERGGPSDQAVVRPLMFEQDLVEPAQRPADLLRPGHSRHAVDRQVRRENLRPKHSGRRAPGDVEESAVINPQRLEEPVHRPDSNPREVRQGGAPMRGRDGRQAQDATGPVWPGDEPPGVESPHAVADQVNGLARKGQVDLRGQRLGPEFHSSDRGNLGDQHPVPAGPQELGDSSEIRS